MKFAAFTKKDIPYAKEIALANYREERTHCSALPEMEDVPDLDYFAENGLGIAAFEQEKLVGYLCCFEPWDEAWDSKATGTFSPLHAHGAVSENRKNIYQRMYEEAARLWVKKGITYQGIALYTHDAEAKEALFEYGFGMRCMDEIRELKRINCPEMDEFCFKELNLEDFPKLRETRTALDRHLWESPCFMVSLKEDRERWLDRVEKGDRRSFVALDSEGRYAAYLDVAEEGENFVTWRPDMMNLQGAYCLPEYRGKGLMNALLDFVSKTMMEEGYKLLGVDHESFNPNALHYWQKYFTPYTCSVTRRIDECALRRKEENL